MHSDLTTAYHSTLQPWHISSLTSSKAPYSWFCQEMKANWQTCWQWQVKITFTNYGYDKLPCRFLDVQINISLNGYPASTMHWNTCRYIWHHKVSLTKIHVSPAILINRSILYYMWEQVISLQSNALLDICWNDYHKVPTLKTISNFTIFKL